MGYSGVMKLRDLRVRKGDIGRSASNREALGVNVRNQGRTIFQRFWTDAMIHSRYPLGTMH